MIRQHQPDADASAVQTVEAFLFCVPCYNSAPAATAPHRVAISAIADRFPAGKRPARRGATARANLMTVFKS